MQLNLAMQDRPKKNPTGYGGFVCLQQVILNTNTRLSLRTQEKSEGP